MQTNNIVIRKLDYPKKKLILKLFILIDTKPFYIEFCDVIKIGKNNRSVIFKSSL